jgi:protocatechuate 3,4-dioxygenase beta subunit
MKNIFTLCCFFAVISAVSVVSAIENQVENTICLRFIDENNNPIDRVPCLIYAHAIDGIGLPSVKKESDADGKIILDLNFVGGRERGFQLYTKRDHYVNIRCQFSKKYGIWPIPNEFTVVLEKGRTIGGTVVGTDNKPIAEATVQILFTEGEPKYRNNLSLNNLLGTCKTDSDGKWSCDKLPIEFRPLFLKVETADYETERFFISTETETTVQNAFEGKLQLQCKTPKQTRLTVQGKITDEDGKPVSNARIWILPDNAQGDTLFELREEIKTGSDGHFQIQLVEGKTLFYIVSPDYAPFWIYKPIHEKGEPLVFTLKRGTPIRFRVVDKDDKPLPDIKVTVDRWLNDLMVFVQFDWIDIPVTDSEGRTIWNHAPEQLMNYLISSATEKNYLRRDFKQLKPGEEHELKLYPALDISGNIVDAETKQPIKMSEISQSIIGHPSHGTLFSDQSVLCNEGTFNIGVPHYQDKIFVRASAKGYRPKVSREIFPGEQQVKLLFELTKDARVRGTVLTPDGKPANEATVLLYSGSEMEKFRLHNGEAVFRTPWSFVGQFLPPNSKTDAEGKFQIPSSELNNVKLHVYHDSGYAILEPQEFVGDIHLHPWATVKGVLSKGKGKKPWADQKLLLYFTSDNDNYFQQYSSSSAMTDKEGHFVFNRVFPEHDSVLVRRWNWAEGLAKFKPKEGQTTELQLGGNGLAVCGKFLLKPEPQQLAEGWKFERATLVPKNSDTKQIANVFEDGEILNFNRRFEKVEKDGSFRFENVLPDEYQLFVELRQIPVDTKRAEPTACVILPNTGRELIVIVPDQKTDEPPIDLGTIEIPITSSLQ